MNTDRDRALDKIRKLLAMANDGRGNEAEAMIAARQAEAMMRKFNIDYAEAIAKEIKSGAGIVHKDVVATAKDNGTPTVRTPTWAQFLAVRVGNLYDAPVRFAHIKTKLGTEQCIRFHGYSADVDVAVWTFEFLVATVNRLCREYRKHPYYIANGRSVMNAYRQGMVDGILRTLQGMIDEKQAVQLSSSTALVVVKQDAIEKTYGEFEYRKATKQEIRDFHAYSAGHEVGKKVQVRTALGGSTTEETRRLA